jgi:hypothetical protein
VAFDESGERTIKVKNVDEFMLQATKVISDAEAVLAV